MSDHLVTKSVNQEKTPAVEDKHLKAELNPICHLLALLGAHHILHVSRIWVSIHKI
jgi:hypothetical protein